MIRVAIGAAAACLLIPVLALGAATGGIDLSTPSATAVAGIPPDYLLLYQEAGLAFNVPWEIVAGIGKVECDHGRNSGPACWQEGATNAAGAGGPMQFLAATWNTYGIDANGDGSADRWDPADAIVSAANFLHANGAPADIAAAIYAYNHSWAYVDEVEQWATRYAAETTDTTPIAVGNGPSSAAAQAAVQYALAQLGTPYRWGGEEPGGFDCSGLVQAAYADAGINLPRVAQDQYDAGPQLPPDAQLEPGDLVFFGAGPSAVSHVGLVVAPGEMVDAPHTGAVVRVESYNWSDFVGATRPTR